MSENFVQCLYRSLFTSRKQNYATITIDGGKHKGSTFYLLTSFLSVRFSR